MIHADEGTLQGYLDDEVPAADRSALEAHLTSCQTCRAGLEELRGVSGQFSSVLSGIDRAPATAAALGEVQARVAYARRPTAPDVVPLRRSFPLRFARASLLKAAALALLVTGAASAAIPDSPLRRWVLAAWQQLVGMDEIAVTAPEAVAPRAPEVVSSVPQEELADPVASLVPIEGRLLVRLEGPQPGRRIRVRSTEGSRAEVRLADPARAELSSGPGRIEVSNLGSGDVLVDVPRWVSDVVVEVDGTVFYRRSGTDVRLPGPVVERDDSEVVFRSRP